MDTVHADMLLQERMLPNNLNVRLVLSRSRPPFHLMDFNGESSYHVRIDEAVLEVRKVKVAACEQLRLEKVLTASVATRHFILAAGASTANVNALFSGQILTKVIIGLVSNEVSFQLCAHGPEPSLLGGGRTTASCPALAAGLYAGPVCKDLPRPVKVRRDVPQQLDQWVVCPTVRGWHHALVLGPDA